MKRLVKILLSLTLVHGTVHSSDDCDYFQEYQEEVAKEFRPGSGCDDGIFTAISASMVGWGVGLFAGIALLTGLFHSHSNSTSSTDSNNSSTNGQ